jgi:hypothetical protein
MDRKISNALANIHINSMMSAKGTVNHAHANHFALIGLALAERNSMTIKLCRKLRRPNKAKAKLYMEIWEALSPTVVCLMGLIDSSLI